MWIVKKNKKCTNEFGRSLSRKRWAEGSICIWVYVQTHLWPPVTTDIYITTGQVTVWKGSLILINPQHIIIQLCRYPHIYSTSSPWVFRLPNSPLVMFVYAAKGGRFQLNRLINSLYATCSAQSNWLAGKSCGAFKSWRARCVCQELPETKTELIGGLIFH